MLPPELLNLVAERLALAGVSRRQLHAAAEAVGTVQWDRLPLYTDAALDGVPLQQFLSVRSPLDAEPFVAAYEEFVAGFLITREYGRQSPAAWLRKSLGLSQVDAAQLFSDAVPRPGRRVSGPRDLLLMTVAVAAVANWTFDTTVALDTPTSFAVNLKFGGRGIDFGIMDGKPITNLGRGKLGARQFFIGPRIALVQHKRGLKHASRGRPMARESAHASIYATLKAFGQVHPEIVGDRDAWSLALSILRHRSRGSEPRRLNEAIVEGVDPVGMRQALRLASGFQQFDNPYRDLKQLLVPAYVDPQTFIDLFGRAPRSGLTYQRVQQWKLALDHLSETIKEAV